MRIGRDKWLHGLCCCAAAVVVGCLMRPVSSLVAVLSEIAEKKQAA